jgi:hypothetical protein
MINLRAANQWEKARIPYGYYLSHIKSKSPKHSLTVLDLLFVKNFKGGSATIAEPESRLTDKLKQYSKHLGEILEAFGGKELGALGNKDLDALIQKVSTFLGLTRDSKTRIDGFGPSFASALLNAHLPELVPILDRRLLNGCAIAGVETDSQGQVKHIDKHYPDLIRDFHDRLSRDPAATIESIDRSLFAIELDDLYKPKDKRSGMGS